MCFVKATGLFGLRKVGCDISAQREITWAASGEESWVTSGEEGRAAPLQSRQHLSSPPKPQTKESKAAAVGLVM